MAKADGTVTSLAIYYALLAFTSLHLNRPSQQAMQFKLLALNSLSASAKKEHLSVAETAQHVAAAMLLGSFEVSSR